jgi:4-amino-4-deoxy-L-arabinose transferase
MTRLTSTLRQYGGILLLLAVSLALKLRHLGHHALTYWDESFHALVAKNLLKHPLKPTLVDLPFLPYDYRGWGENHVWLHKPILPLWQIALSYALFGVNAFALRLPSALLSTGAVLLTYLIGKELLDRRAALVAATAQAFNPSLMQLIHGYLYSDHIDIALLFWVEVGVYFVVRTMRTGRLRDATLAGVAQGLAYHSKSYLGLIITGLAVTAWLLPTIRLGRRDASQVRGRHILILLGATLVTVAPWTLHCIANYPQEWFHEEIYVWLHLTTDIEAWGAPWDRLVFDYSIHLYHVFYTPILVASFALVWRAFKRRDTGLWFVYAWGLGVLIPHLLATTKTPSATVIGMPPAFLLLGAFVSEAWRRNRWAAVTWLAVVAWSLATTPKIEGWGRGYPNPLAFGAIMRQAIWVVWHVAGSLGVGVVLESVCQVWERRRWATLPRWGWHWAMTAGLVLASAGTVLLGARTVRASWDVVRRNANEPTFSDIARYMREELPSNGVYLFDFENEKGNWGDHQLTMFLADRTCYRFEGDAWIANGRTIREKGGIPYVVSHGEMPLPKVYTSVKDARTIYEWREPDAPANPTR